MKGTEGCIFIYGAEGASAVLECMLIGNGYQIVRLDDREELVKRFTQDNALLLLYDFNTKAGNETDCLAFLAKLRQSSKKPILAITDREKDMLKILALNAGADDVMDRECSSMEAVARIQAQIRCYQRFANHAQPSVLQLDGLEIDDSSKTVTVHGRPVELTPTEYKILKLLLECPGRVLSNKQIYESIWKMEPLGADNTIAVHIRHIREKIEENPQEPYYLQVVWGQGYKVG